jgi:hypothetical protein
MLLLMFITLFMIVSVSYSQPGDRATSEIAFYKMTGPLQVFSLADKQARIDDITWALADTFRTKDIPRDWKRKGTVEFTERNVWVYYYVSLVTVTKASTNSKQSDKKKIQLITDPEEIKEIHDKGGKIYKIELAPM